MRYLRYCYDSCAFNRTTVVRYLDVLLDNKLGCIAQYEYVIGRAMKTIGLVHRMCRDLRDVPCLKGLYCGLARPILDNATIFWCPSQAVWIFKRSNAPNNILLRSFGYTAATLTLQLAGTL